MDGTAADDCLSSSGVPSRLAGFAVGTLSVRLLSAGLTHRGSWVKMGFKEALARFGFIYIYIIYIFCCCLFFVVVVDVLIL